MCGSFTKLAGAAALAAIVAGGCTVSMAAPASSTASAASTSTTTSATTSTTTAPTTSTSTTTTTTTPTTTSTTTTTTTLPALDLPVWEDAGEPSPPLDRARQAFDALARANAAATMTVVRNGKPIVQVATGTTIDGQPATSASPMVVASVSKVLTALAIARLEQAGELALDDQMPWDRLGLSPHQRWDDVTIRELLAHTSGMSVSRYSWFDGGTDCAGFLPSLLGRPPANHRGRWTYSNGNYCALGLLVGALTGEPLDQAVQRLALDPAGADVASAGGVHLTTGGQQPGDVAYSLGVERLSRLGGAGSLIVSTDALAIALGNLTVGDRETLLWPGVMVDQYGWGHTGTIDGAKACVWVIEDGRTAVAVTVAGRSPSTGGAVCDRILPALAADLGLPASGTPDRSPP